MLGSLAAAAMASSTISTDAGGQLTQGQIRAYGAISELSRQTCGRQASSGKSVTFNAKAGAALNIDKLKQALGAAGVSIAGGSAIKKWDGPLQRDVGAALVSHANCVEKTFVAMVVHLPLTDATTGRPIPRTPSPHAAFKAASEVAHVAPTGGVSGNINSNGQQIAATGTSSNIQIGGPTGNGSTVTQNNYLTAVTPDQKQQAREALLTDLGELARYPERGAIEPGPSLVQHHFRYKAPRSLYLLLSKYNYSTIATIPGGKQLNDFEASYYSLESLAPTFEEKALAKIGSKVQQHTPYAWAAIYEYCINRTAGFPEEEIVKQTGEMNFGISPQEAESVCQEIKMDPEIGPGLLQEVNYINQLTNLTFQLLGGFKGG